MPPLPITDVTTYTAPVMYPADGDAETGGSVLQGMQALANRDAFLKNILSITGGANVLFNGSAAAMQALTNASHPLGIPNGSIYYVPGQGIYSYFSAGSLTVDNKFVYTATGMGSGQWQHEMVVTLLPLATFGAYVITSGPIAAGGTFPIALNQQYGGFTLVSNTVQVPAAGVYSIEYSASFTSTIGTSPAAFITSIQVGAAVQTNDSAMRYSAVAGDSLSISGMTVFNITTPATQKISLINSCTNSLAAASFNQMIIKRLS